MNSRLFFVLAPFCISFGISGLGCGGGDPVSQGKAAIEERLCNDCHGENLAGDTMPRAGSMSYAANLTPDMETGIGGWTADQIKKALIEGVDDEGATLCSEMPRIKDLSDAEAANIAAYLKSLPAVKKEIPASTCAGK